MEEFLLIKHRSPMDASTTEKTNSGKGEKRPRFQLCFSTRDATSKTDVQRASVKLLGISTTIITPKFYSPTNQELTEEEEREIETLVRKLEKINDLGPREKYKEPVLESHRYGWFQDKFIEMNPNVDRVHYPRRTSDMVRIQNLFAEFKAKIGDRCE